MSTPERPTPPPKRPHRWTPTEASAAGRKGGQTGGRGRPKRRRPAPR